MRLIVRSLLTRNVLEVEAKVDQGRGLLAVGLVIEIDLKAEIAIETRRGSGLEVPSIELVATDHHRTEGRAQIIHRENQETITVRMKDRGTKIILPLLIGITTTVTRIQSTDNQLCVMLTKDTPIPKTKAIRFMIEGGFLPLLITMTNTEETLTIKRLKGIMMIMINKQGRHLSINRILKTSNQSLKIYNL
jgi:hypothetical protein